ncbi:hypothetical protein PLICRDRAFT_355137 [Plicaturopsis crispa FD-325 SS-3]|uniref:Uncharacterized protein n=1 Tax=Plicaturopsis crispa FD-325 SS-3 TaxID=944288 RepID=A0A0C9SRG0_PLICR|nr:hypothetical protein PLICRDRAFT_355137 [Plicaturopsis crispa FD-325 SS-3]
MAVLMGKTMVELRRLPVIATNTGCAYTGLLPTSSLFWTPALIFEPILCLCVVVKTWKDLPRGIIWGPAKTLPAVLARDSFMYFITVFASLLAATIIWAHYPHYINLINPWASAIPSLLGSRLLLNMRATMLETEVLTTKGIGMPMDDDTITLPPLVAANAQA